MSNFDPLSSHGHTQIHLLLCLHWQAGGKKKSVPSLSLGLTLKYLEDLKNASSIHKIMQHWSWPSGSGGESLLAGIQTANWNSIPLAQRCHICRVPYDAVMELNLKINMIHQATASNGLIFMQDNNNNNKYYWFHFFQLYNSWMEGSLGPSRRHTVLLPPTRAGSAEGARGLGVRG